jgi:hypothetical protein
MSDISSDYATDSSDDDILFPPIIPVAIIAATMEEEEEMESNSTGARDADAAMTVMSVQCW